MKINLLLFTQIVPIFITPPSFLKFHFPLIQFFFLTSLSLETSFTFLLELECWQQTDIILLHLRISFISFHSWRIFSLNIEFWIFSCFLPAFLGMVHGFWWKVCIHLSYCSLACNMTFFFLDILLRFFFFQQYDYEMFGCDFL